MNQCPHGQLARSCDRCEDAAEIKRLNEQRRELQAERARLLEGLGRAGLHAQRMVNAERERIRKALLARHEQAGGAHNYYACLAREIDEGTL